MSGLGELAGLEAPPAMMLAAEELRVVPVTIHRPLAEVPKALRTGEILRIGKIVAAALARDFGIARPRLAVAGLNPHAGEGGSMGGEDAEIVAPAVAALRASGIDTAGPLSADTMFHAAARARYDAALCMYHDQALIPIKTLAFDRAVKKVAAAASQLLDSLETHQPPRDRDEVAAKARARSALRFAKQPVIVFE